MPYVSKYFLNHGSKSWGVMDPVRWDAFLDWLSVEGLLTTKIQSTKASPRIDRLGRPGIYRIDVSVAAHGL